MTTKFDRRKEWYKRYRKRILQGLEQCRMCYKFDRLLTFDHLIPKSKGGVGRFDNATLLCTDCQRIKADNIWSGLISLADEELWKGRPVFEIPKEPGESRMTIGPLLAAKILDAHNKRNRPISWKKVKTYAAQMRKGNWLYNPSDAFSFDTEAILLNGQHRLLAVLESETDQEFLLAFGVDPDAQNVMDTGIRRTTAHQLAIEGHPSSNMVAAIGRQYIKWHEGTTANNQAWPTTMDVKNWLDSVNEDALKWAINEALRIGRNLPMNPGPIGATLYDFYLLDPEDAMEFVEQLVEGQGLEKGNPILTLTKYLQRQSLAGIRHKPHHQLWLMVSTWNHWRSGKPLMKIMSPSEWRNYTFPYAK